MTLTDRQTGPISLDTESIPANQLAYQPDFLLPAEADSFFCELYEEIEWQRDSISLFGRQHPIPRLHQWYADPGINYRWSGLDMRPLTWISPLERLRRQLQEFTKHRFNSVLANLYRDGQDSMGWHADDEPELGPEPVIASISLGAERDFRIRPRSLGGDSKYWESRNYPLEHGSLLLMWGNFQTDYMHSLPKRMRCKKPRINLTFRWIHQH